MSFIQTLKKLFCGFEDLFLSNHACLCCRREIPDGTEFSLCENCVSKLDKIEGKTCKFCGEKIEGNVLVCDRCKTAKYNFEKNTSFAYYDEVAGRIVKRFKYSSKKYYAEYIARLMASKKEVFDGVDYLTFVPVGVKRKRERGFNQAEELAKEISKIVNIEVVELLEKVGSEKHQAGLSQKERMENLKGTFCLKEENVKLLKNKTILIIDDVFTTGSTLSECAKVLLSKRGAKPKSVLTYTFAKTRLFSSKNG
ncbi:MAG: ComF family protein [Clostridia bacterium]|nr:ComF family protein [Clostridia bacterium]